MVGGFIKVAAPAAVLAVGLAACSSPEEVRDGIGLAQSALGDAPKDIENGIENESAQAALNRRTAAQAEPFAFSDSEGTDQTGTRTFSYAWPRQVSAIPALAEDFERDRQARLDEQKRHWAQAIADCPAEFIACRNAMFSLEWQVVADTPRFLSLSSNLSTYAGGAHGNYGRGAALWDREAAQRLEPVQLFTSLAALEDALGKTACAMLNREREIRRGGPVIPSEQDWANACVPMEDAVIFAGSSNGDRLDRIGIYYAPYVAGPYAEGDFEFTVPVTREVIAALRPRYRGAFADAP